MSGISLETVVSCAINVSCKMIVTDLNSKIKTTIARIFSKQGASFCRFA